MRISQPSSFRRAAAAVELAVLAPLLILLLVGVWEIGRFIQLQQVMNNAARDGARLASQASIISTTGSYTEITTANVQDAMRQYLQAAGISNLTGLQVTFDFLDGNTALTDPYQGVKNQKFRVRVSLPYANLRWTNLSIINPTTLGGECVWQLLVDDPFTLDPSLPGWSP